MNAPTTSAMRWRCFSKLCRKKLITGAIPKIHGVTLEEYFAAIERGHQRKAPECHQQRTLGGVIAEQDGKRYTFPSKPSPARTIPEDAAATPTREGSMDPNTQQSATTATKQEASGFGGGRTPTFTESDPIMPIMKGFQRDIELMRGTGNELAFNIANTFANIANGVAADVPPSAYRTRSLHNLRAAAHDAYDAILNFNR